MRKKTMLKKTRSILLGSLVAFAPLAAHADQSSEDRMREQLRQAVMALRQEQDENADLKIRAEAGTPAPVAAAPVPKVDKAGKAQLEQARRNASEQQQRADDLQKQVDDLKAQLAKAQADAADAQRNQLKATQDADNRAAAAQELADNDSRCQSDNQELVTINQTLLQRYDERSVWDVLWRSEPVTGIPHIEVERLVQTWHSKVVDAGAPPAPVVEAAVQPVAAAPAQSGAAPAQAQAAEAPPAPAAAAPADVVPMAVPAAAP